MVMNVKGVLTAVIFALVGVVVVLQLMAGFATPLQQASDNITAQSTLWGSLTSLFESGGVLYIIITAAVISSIGNNAGIRHTQAL